MQNSQFERLLRLAQRTGDRLIVTDPSGEEPVVILPLAEYEGLLDYGSFRKGGKSQIHEERPHEDVRKPSFEVEGSSTIGVDFNVDPMNVEAEIEGEFDPEALEEQVLAAMTEEEPEVVPVQPILEAPRRPVSRKDREESGGEEQFYLEPV